PGAPAGVSVDARRPAGESSRRAGRPFPGAGPDPARGADAEDGAAGLSSAPRATALPRVEAARPAGQGEPGRAAGLHPGSLASPRGVSLPSATGHSHNGGRCPRRLAPAFSLAPHAGYLLEAYQNETWKAPGEAGAAGSGAAGYR